MTAIIDIVESGKLRVFLSYPFATRGYLMTKLSSMRCKQKSAMALPFSKSQSLSSEYCYEG